ncbi:hypothetical protein J416_15222 [Gracilibacillus halophilus YIM-C55.5]|uniref:Kynurenine formamidase n=1 Tax=Gracilibacillus halophilus YIM-C55.5 TaxID=1308866 RepID=N4W5X5_9BACI|nr:cyclase family protein [Gracilibacillus halophilus]ENH95588.1 hypothetical protein J416_15222 [Gracilibacillus halophilus YIM-C55.5]
MKFHDISMAIHEDMQVWEDSDSKRLNVKRETNAHITESTITMNLHTGTHIDAPLHMINDADTFETIPMNQLIRQVKVLNLQSATDGITRADLQAHPIKKGDFLLFQTKNSFHQDQSFDFQFIYLTEDGADYLIEKDIIGVGIDTLGIERSQQGNPTHRKLFRKQKIILEGLRLAHINPGNYFMVAAPLKMIGTEAAPARVFLFEQDIS